MASFIRADCHGLTRDELGQLVVQAGGMVAGTVEEAVPLLCSGFSVYLVTSDSADAAELKVRWYLSAVAQQCLLHSSADHYRCVAEAMAEGPGIPSDKPSTRLARPLSVAADVVTHS